LKGFRFFAIVAGVLAACCALSSSPARAAGEFCPAVAVNADGGLASAWIYQPSGSRQADRAALEAAEASRYRAGTALCAPAPGIYMFRVTFAPH